MNSVVRLLLTLMREQDRHALSCLKSLGIVSLILRRGWNFGRHKSSVKDIYQLFETATILHKNRIVQ